MDEGRYALKLWRCPRLENNEEVPLSFDTTSGKIYALGCEHYVDGECNGDNGEPETCIANLQKIKT